MSVEISRVKGIPIRVHFTLVITFFIFAWTISSYLMPAFVEGLDTIEYWTMGILATILLFFSIVLHELAHSLVAIKYGIPVRSITLFIFGGVSDITKEPREFRKEFDIGIAGPLTSFAIAFVLMIAFWVTGPEIFGVENYLTERLRPILYYGAIINTLLGGFNLIPAFPLDGGRIFRAVLVRWKNDYAKATRIASTVGVGMSYFFMAVGFLSMFSGNLIGGIWIILIGWFLHSGAQSYRLQFELTEVLKEIKIKDLANENIVSIEKGTTIDTVLKEYFQEHMKSEFPVVDKDGLLLGAITLKDAKKVEEDDKKTSLVEDVMVPVSEIITVNPQTTSDKVILQIIQKRQGRAYVCDKKGLLTGLVSKTDIINVAGERQEYLKNIKA